MRWKDLMHFDAHWVLIIYFLITFREVMMEYFDGTSFKNLLIGTRHKDFIQLGNSVQL